jgi:protein-L-isoaspartate(D-aspartate) O-methyltransferase
MHGWIIPPPKEPLKTAEEFREERERKVGWLVGHGYLRSERIRSAMLTVRREDFIPAAYRDYAYSEVPLPLPGKKATISCPHSYPLFYEPLGLDEGQRFLEIGLGSGYGAALAREVVGGSGLVVSVEIDPETLEFARRNLESAGYRDIVLVQGDGGLGAPTNARFDRICMTAACPAVPPPRSPSPFIGADGNRRETYRTLDGSGGSKAHPDPKSRRENRENSDLRGALRFSSWKVRCEGGVKMTIHSCAGSGSDE